MENVITRQQPYEVIQIPVRLIQRAMPFTVHNPVPWPGNIDGIVQLAPEKDLKLEIAANSIATNRRFALLQFMLDASPQGIMLTDLDGNLVLRNSALLRLFDLSDPKGEEQEKNWIDRFASKVKNQDQMLRILNLILKEKTGETLDFFELKSGRLLECQTRFQMIEQLGESFRMWSFLDCTEQYRRESVLQHLSMHDPLTGVYNRAYFDLKLSMFRHSDQCPVAVVMLDVDGLKKVNDCRGHLAGDELLCQVARILRQACRKGDISARLGGDEFALLLAQTDAGIAEHIIDRIQGLLNLHNIRQPALPISLSMGSAVAYDEYEVDSLVARADGEMYFARRERRAKG